MGRYSGKAVTISNDFVSQESNTIDPNSDNNPLLDNDDPSKGNEPDREHGDDFQVAGEDLVEVKKVTENEVYEEGEVLNKITSIDNIVKEGQTNSSVIEALAAVSTEMYGILATHGKMTPGEYLAVSGIVASCEAAMPSLRETETAMPSMEDFKIPGLGYSNTNVSMEGIGEKIDSAFNTLGLNIERLFKNGVGLANSLTPLFTSQINRANTLRGSLNNAHRDAGQKTVSGKFVSALSIDGHAPDATTVLKTVNYLGEITDQVLSYASLERAQANVTTSMQAIKEGIDLKNVKRTGFLAKLIVLFGGNNVVTFLASEGIKSDIYDQLTFDGDYTIDMFEAYSTLAKVQASSDHKHLEARKTLPLFGGNEIVVTNYKRNFSTKINHSAVPSIRLIKGDKSGGGEMQSLSGQQQQQVIAGALKILLAGRDYYKNYAVRNKRAMDTFKAAFKGQQQSTRDNIDAGRRFENLYVNNAYNYYTRLYWRGIFVDQSKIGVYCRKTAKALLDLAESSSAGAQGGSVSTEAFSDFL